MEVSINDIFDIINKLDINKSPGQGLSIAIKIVYIFLYSPYNCSINHFQKDLIHYLENGFYYSYTNIWPKTAIVYYRPISIMSIIPKIFELLTQKL